MVTPSWKTYLTFGVLLIGWGLFASCGKSGTKELLTNKKWVVEDVTPPSGAFNIENAQRAKQLKNGFYKGAWFEFLEDSLFVASFGGKVDTAQYALIAKDEVELYPKGRSQAYERILILDISQQKLKFNTEMADFKMTLHLKAEPLE